MPLETGTFVNDLAIANPPGTDSKSQGDDHLRLIKSVLKNTFPLAVGPRKFRDDTNSAADTLLLTLYRNRPAAFPAANDSIASLIYSANNLAGTEKNYARIRGTIVSPANGVEQGRLDFYTMYNGVETATMSATPIAFAAAGISVDNNNCILSADGVGGTNTIWFRPNGLNDSTGEMSINSVGIIEINGASAQGAVIYADADIATTGVNGQQLAVYAMRGWTNTGVKKSFVDIYSNAMNVVNGAEDGRLIINTMLNGAMHGSFALQGDAVTLGGNTTVTAPYGYYGIGSGITALDATNLTLGTLPNARLPATITVTRLNATDMVVPLHYFNAADADTYIQYVSDGIWRSVCNGVEMLRAAPGGLTASNFITTGSTTSGQFTTTNGSYVTTAGNFNTTNGSFIAGGAGSFTTVSGSFITTNGGVSALNGEMKAASILVNKAAPSIANNGLELGTNGCWVTKAGNDVLLLNRIGPFGGTANPVNGSYIAFYQSGVAIGNMQNINGAITLNAFIGSHWSQTINNLRVSPIYQGTVVESLDTVCFWAGEPTEDRLPRFKVSDVVDSPAVYGVWLDWDESDVLNDAMIATSGLAWVRMKSGQVVVKGDLVSSNGDGCAKKQTGTAITNATLGKIVSNTVHETYPDGSFRLSIALRGG